MAVRWAPAEIPLGVSKRCPNAAWLLEFGKSISFQPRAVGRGHLLLARVAPSPVQPGLVAPGGVQSFGGSDPALSWGCCVLSWLRSPIPGVLVGLAPSSSHSRNA